MLLELPCTEGDAFDKSPLKARRKHHRFEVTQPLVLVLAEQFCLALYQCIVSIIVPGESAQLALNANQFGATRFPSFLEPIGIDEPRRVVIGRGPNVG